MATGDFHPVSSLAGGTQAVPLSFAAIPPASSLAHVPLRSESVPVNSLTTTIPAVMPTQWSAGSLPCAQSPLTPGVILPSPLGLTLSPATGLIPQKLVDKVRAGGFVEMWDFLPDNIRLIQQLESVQGGPIQFSALPGVARPRLREVLSPISWIFCFLAFMGTSTSDPMTRKQAAYAGLILMEAQRHGGRGWLDYDKAFRTQAAGDPSLPWNVINQGIQASTILGSGPFCTLCRRRITQPNTARCPISSLLQPPVIRRRSHLFLPHSQVIREGLGLDPQVRQGSGESGPKTYAFRGTKDAVPFPVTASTAMYVLPVRLGTWQGTVQPPLHPRITNNPVPDPDVGTCRLDLSDFLDSAIVSTHPPAIWFLVAAAYIIMCLLST